MQPTYLPWLGYFDLMDHVDAFVFLDDVQFSKQSWQQRNRIKTAAGPQWLTVPVKHRSDRGIIDVELVDAGFCRKHLLSVEQNYRKASHFSTYFPTFAEVLRRGAETGLLVELNVSLISWMASAIGIRVPFFRSNAMGISGERSERLVRICETLEATDYLSPLGSKVYLLDELGKFKRCGISVSFQHYEHPVYRQLYGPFIPFASAIDLLFNEGSDSLEIIRSGRRRPFIAADVALGCECGGMNDDAN